MNAHPPIPGAHSFWQIWDVETNAYRDSEFPLPELSSGTDGKSAYSYAVDAGYTGTEEEFAVRLAAAPVPTPTESDIGKVPVVQDDLAWGLESIEASGNSNLKLIIQLTTTEEVNAFSFSSADYPDLVNLKTIVIHIAMPTAGSCQNWWRVQDNHSTQIINGNSFTSAYHLYGWADARTGYWAQSSGNSPNNSAGQNLNPPALNFKPFTGISLPVYKEFDALKVYGNSLTVPAGSTIQIWGAK